MLRADSGFHSNWDICFHAQLQFPARYQFVSSVDVHQGLKSRQKPSDIFFYLYLESMQQVLGQRAQCPKQSVQTRQPAQRIAVLTPCCSTSRGTAFQPCIPTTSYAIPSAQSRRRAASARNSTIVHASSPLSLSLPTVEGYTEVEEVKGSRVVLDGETAKAEYLVKWKVRETWRASLHRISSARWACLILRASANQFTLSKVTRLRRCLLFCNRRTDRPIPGECM